ncbi:MAG: DHH family phosphoesterase [Theionarchaea archaeon]|nr:DHH family phosphoesterase [Theionarchaea archaeon]MBU7000582.1 DHH family phosphoesterase [Theionarchaea archaeon]MBU7020484.1 DHH family phosphoesterase [Theionarchaea archaeon]MBU7034474.1 DHH family phosphoesterase [Theionarchaea archaeon]MBU7039777.1 DHH family phosphoesterase [Theionarchaea archaeon]
MSEFEGALREASRILKNNQPFQVITHGDVDGVAAGALALSAFDCRVTIQKRLAMEKLDPSQFTLFLDMGSSQCEEIEERFSHYLIIDHHPAAAYGPHVVNPWMYGIDGTRELCAAATFYLVIKRLGKEYRRLSYLGLVGALGDRQSLDTRNCELFEDAVETGVLQNNLLFNEYELSEFVKVVNACCRNSKKELAMDICLLRNYSQGKEELEIYNRIFERDLQYLTEKWCTITRENEGRVSIYVHDETLTRKYAGELATTLARTYERPVIILVRDEEGIKISGRATSALVTRGVHLGNAFQGFGGGHDVAAGAFLQDEEMIETFIQVTDQRLHRMIAPIRVELDIPVKDASMVMKVLAIDNLGYDTIDVTAEKDHILVTAWGSPGTVKNTIDDVIACVISAVSMMEGE